MKCPKLLLGAALLASTCLLNPRAHAADAYWDVNGTTAGSGAVDGSTVIWNTNPLWNAASDGTGSTAAWTSGNTAVFAAGTDASGTYIITVSGTQNISGLRFEEGTFSLTGGTLSIASAAGGTGDINVAAGLTATIDSIIAGSPSGTTVLTKTGSGTLVLNGVNTFGGTGKRFAIREGTLSFSNNSALGSTSNSLDLGTATTTATLRYTGATATISRAIALAAPAASSVGNVIEITNASTVLTLSGVISGGPGNSTQAAPGTNTALTIRGAGTLDLSGTNTFTGDIVVDGATFNVNALTDWGGATVASSTSHTITLTNGGKMAITTTTAVNPGATTTTTHNLLQIGTGGGTVDVMAAGTLQLDDAGQFFGSGTLTKTGAGTLWLGNAFTNYTGTQINVNGGILQLQNAQATGATGASAAITMAGGTTLNLRTTGNTNFGSNVTLTGNVTIAPGRSTGSATSITHTMGTLTMGSHTLTVSLGANLQTNAVGNLVFGATTLTGNPIFQLDALQGTGVGSLTLGAVDGGASARTITKLGLGTLIFGADATSLVAGSELLVKAGNAQVNTSSALGSASVQVGDTSGTTAAGFLLGADGVNFSNTLTVNSGSTGVMTVGGSNTTGTATFLTNISFANNLTLTAATGGTVRFDANLLESGGARNINKVGGGVVELRGANNYTGTTTITAGVLAVTTIGDVNTGITSLGAPTTAAAGTIALAGGTLRYIGTAVGGHSTNRDFTMSASSGIEASGVGELTLTGTLTVTDGSMSLGGTGVGNLNNTTLWAAGPGDDFNKNGTGTWNLNGATSAPDDWNINEGVINANVMDALNATDDVIIDGTGLADSVIVNLKAADVFSGNEFYIRNGGRVNVYVDDAFFGTDVNQLLIGDSASTGTGAAFLHLGNPANPSATANISLGANGLQLGASGGNTGSITGKGIITSAGTFSLRNGSIGSDITLAGAGGITKVGNGVVTFSGTRTATGATAIQEGELILDYSTNNSSKIGGALTLGTAQPNVVGGGKLTMNGIAGGASAETVTGTTVLAGASEVALNAGAGAGSSVTLNLGGLTRTALGGTVAFTYGTANVMANSTTLNTFLNYATLTTGGTTRFAATNALGNIVQASEALKSDIGTWVGTDNVVSTGAFTGQIGNRASVINSLTFDTPSSSISALPNRRLTISSGGILVSSAVGASNIVISGGQIAGSATAPLGELIIHQNNTLGSLEIASNIVNSAGLTKSGLGELILSGNNSFAATSTLVINEGTLTARGGNAIGDTTVVHLKQGATLAIGDGDTETVGRLGVDTTNISSGTVALGNGSRLNINQGTTNTVYAGVFTGGANTTITKTGNGNLQLTGNTTTGFSGTLAVNGGLVYIAGSTGRLSSAAEIIVNKGGSFMIDNNDDSSPNDRLSNTAAITLHSADGAWSGETRPKGLMIRTDNNGDETESVGVLTIASGSNYATLEGTGTGTNVSIASIIASNFVRNVGTTLDVRGINLGGTTNSRGQLKIADGANEVAFLASTNLVGGGAAVGAGNKNVSIVPWAIGENTTIALVDTNMGNTFLTYVDNRGFVALDLATEYRAYATAGTAQDNVREVLNASVANLTGNTVNSLILHDNTTDAGTLAFTGTGAGQALTVTSGAFLFTLNTGATTSSAHTINVGGFDDGIKVGSTNEYLFFVVNPSSATNTPTLTVNVASPLNSTTASLTKAGRGTLVLSGTNTYGGGTYLNEGVLQISNLTNLGTGAINFAGGTLRLGAGFAEDLSTRALTTTATGGFIDTNGINTVWANGLDITGTGPVAKTGNGLMTIQGASTYTGTFVAGHSSSTTGANTGVSQGVVLNGITNQTITGNLQVGSTVVPAAGIAGVALGADEQIANTSVIIFNGSTSSSRWAYFKMLGHNETVAGISDSTGAGVLENRESDVVTSGATLTLNSDDDYSYNGYLRDNSSGTADVNPLSLVKLGSGTQTLSGNQIRYTGGTTVSGGVLYLLNTTVFNSAITNNASVVFDYTSGTALTLTRDMAGSGTYIKRGTGTVEWNGNNTFSGQLAIEEGVLSFSSSLGNNAVGNFIRIHENATLRSTGADNTLGNNQAIDLGGSVVNIDVAGAAANKLTVRGVISGGAQTALQKQGAGRLILSGANTYAGQTRVLAGALELRNTAALGASSSTTVANGASLVFNASAAGPAGNFTLNGTGSVLSLGSAGGSATLGFGINGATNDKLILASGQTLTIGGNSVLTDIFINGMPTLSSYNLIQSADTMDFSKFTLGTIFNPGSFTYSLNTSGTNNLVLNVTAAAAPSVAYWKGDLGGTGTGVWSAYQIAPNSTNWDTTATSGVDTGVAPGANTDVFFAANGAANYATTLGADIAVRGVTFMSGSGTGGNNTTVGGPHTLTLGAGGITLAAGSGSINISAAIAMATSQTWHVADAGATLTASGGLSGTGDFAKSGAGTVVLSGNSTYSGTTTINLGTLQIGAGGTTGTLGAGNVVNNGVLIINRAGTYVVNQNISGSGSLVKTGSGAVTFNGTLNYFGSTTLDGGTTVFGVSQTAFVLTSNSLIFGATAGSATASNLDLSSASAKFGGAMTVQTNSATANTITIGAGQSLEVEGNVMVGYAPATGVGTTSLDVDGAGSFNVTNLTSGAFFRVGGYDAGTAGIGNRAIADFSGLASMNVSLNTTNGLVRVSNLSSGNTTGSYSTLLLAQNSTLTAHQLIIGDGGQFNNPADQINEMRLGSGVNTLNFNQILIGNGTRDYGALVFNTASGSLFIRNAAGTGRATFNMATAGGTSTGTTNIAGNTFSTVGHNADLFLGVVTIGSQNRGNALLNTFSFDQGTLDMQRLVMSTRSANPSTGTATNWTTNSIMNLGGGTVNIVEGITNFAGTSGTLTAGTAVTATLNLTGGNITVGTTGGTSVTMATAAASTAATAAINISGTANVTMNGNIVRGGGAGTSTATVTLNGGTLNMTGKAIGGSAADKTIVFNLQQGTLRNLGEYNGGGTLVKTTSGVVNMEGTHSYTGQTQVNDGTMHFNSATYSGAGSFTVAKTAPLSSTAVLSGTGTIASSVTLGSTTAGVSGILKPGTNLGTGHGTLTIGGDLTVNTGSQIQMTLGIATLNSAGFRNALMNGTAVNALDYLQQNSSEVAVWNVAPAVEGDSDYIKITGALSTPTVGDRATGAYGDGSIVVSLGTGFNGGFGSVFNLVDWLTLSNISGTFDVGSFTVYDASGNVIAGDLDLPTLGTGLSWDVSAFSQYGVLVVVPEPGRAMLFVFGVAALFMRRRRAGR